MGHGCVGRDEQGLRRHREYAPGRHSIFGVHGQIQYHLIDLSPVCANGTGLGIEIPEQADVFADQPLNHRTDRRQRFIEVEDLVGKHLATAEGQELPGQGRCPLTRGQDFLQ